METVVIELSNGQRRLATAKRNVFGRWLAYIEAYPEIEGWGATKQAAIDSLTRKLERFLNGMCS